MLDANFWQDKIKSKNIIKEKKLYEDLLNSHEETQKKLKDFVSFQISTKLMKYAKKDVTFLHCLPRGTEVSDKVFLGKNSKVWLQALNRAHVQKSILLYCFGKLR